MAATLSLFPLQARPRPFAFVPGDDGTAIRAHDVRGAGRTEPAVGGPSLDDVLVDAWEGLATHRSVSCPVCRGSLRPRYGAASRAPIGGRCDDCGSTLA